MATSSSTATQTLPPDVEKIKAEGNALYTSGNHKAAIEKFDEAIAQASDNAILYANRAACYIGLRKYQQALQDASKATECDPSYPKGWGRLGACYEALNQETKAREAYHQAVSCIDSMDPVSSANARLREQYRQSYTTLHQRTHLNVVKNSGHDWPWVLAQKLDNPPPESSAHVILASRQMFMNSLEILKSLQQFPNGLMGGRTGGIAELSNAILMDSRCFAIPGGLDFMKLHNDYVIFELSQTQVTSAWKDTRDPYTLFRLAKDLQARLGWDAVRPALSISARAWFMRGFLGENFGLPIDEAIPWYERVLTLLRLGREEWPDVDKVDRGAIFEKTWIRGIKRVHLSAYMSGYKVPHLRKRGKFTLDEMIRLADEIIDDVDTDEPIGAALSEKGFISAFFNYPKADAYAIKGFAYFSQGNFQSEATMLEDRECARRAADSYLKSADLFPEDDEQHCFMLSTALDYYSMAKTPAREILRILERVKIAYPKMLTIWKHSQLSMDNGHKKIEQLVELEKDLRQAVDAGVYSLDDPVMINSVPK